MVQQQNQNKPEGEDRLEKGAERTASSISDKTAQEALEGKEDLIKEQRKSSEEIKLGKRRTGVTEEFGVVSVISENDEVKPRNDVSTRMLVDELTTVDTRPDTVLSIMRGLSKDDLEQISKLYESKTGHKLEADLRKELDGKQQKEALDLLAGKVTADSSDGRDATKKTVRTLDDEFGTVAPDGATVLKALQGKTREQLREIAKTYKEETGRDLETDIRKAAEWQKKQPDRDVVESGQKLSKALEVLKAADAGDKRGDQQGDKTEVKKTLKLLDDEFDTVAPDGATVLKALDGKTKDQLREISKAYKEYSGRDLEADIRRARDYQKKDADTLESSQKLGKALDLLVASHLHPAKKAADVVKPADAPAKPKESQEKPADAPARERPAEAVRERSAEAVRERPAEAVRERPAEAVRERPAEAPPKPVDVEAMKKAANDLYNAMEGAVGTDEEAVYKILQGKSEAELKVLDEEYRKRSDQGFTLDQALRDEMSGLELKRALNFLNHKDSDVVKLPEGVDRAKVEAANAELYKATRRDEDFGETPEGWGTDEKAIFKALEGKTPDELKAMDALFKEKYGCSLDDILKDEMSGVELTRAQDLLHGVKLTDHSDGSQTKVYPDKSRVEVDANHRVTESIAANGEKRSFQYQGEELSQVKGQLGTWTRSVVDENGNSTWTSDTGNVWKGEFNVDSDGDLHYVPREGQAWTFTRDGRDVKDEVEPIGRGEQVLDLPVDHGQEALDLGDPGFTPKTTGDQVGDPGFTPRDTADESADGVSELDLTVMRDADGHPTMINYPNGRPSRTIEYASDGNPTSVKTEGSEWRKEGDKWTEYDADGKKRNSAKDVEVGSNGDITIRNENGNEVVIHADGGDSWMLRDGSGRPNDIVYPNGQTREISYDRSGEPRLIKEGDGSEWRKKGDQWIHRGKDGKEIERADSIEISEDGEITTRSGNDTFTLARDGEEYGIARNDDGKPTRIQYENGRPAADLEYDAGGNLTRVRGQESEWRKEGDKWAQYDAAGVKTNTAVSIEVNNDGDLKIRHEGGTESVVYRDGDSSMVMTDSAGRPQTIWSKDGSTYEVSYDAAGQPASVKLSDGSEWKKEGAGWKRHGENGADLGSAESIEVSPKGEITIRSGNDVYVSNVEGRHFGMQRDEHDRPTSISYENGRPPRNVEYDSAGNVARVSSDGFEWRKEGTKWVEYDQEGKKADSAKSVEVSSNGDLTVRKDNGDEFVIYSTGQDSWLLRDKAGRPTDISYPDGRSNEISYDRAGHVTYIKQSDGSEWKKEGDVWKCHNAKGEQIWTAKSIEVTSSGEIVMKGRGHDDVTIGRDGKNYGLFRDDQDRPMIVYYPGGAGNQLMGYDEKGNLSSVRSESGYEWRKEGDKWVQYNDKYEQVNTAVKVEVASNGDLSIRYEGGHESHIFHDGTTLVITRDKAGHPEAIHYPDGSQRAITYDAAGNPISIRAGDGSTWKKEGDVWKSTGPKGEVLGTADSIQVLPSGEIKIRTGNVEVSIGLDNAKVYPDHSRVKETNGKVVEAKTADGKGREFKYDGDKLTEVHSTFTGHTWKRSEVNGKEAWVNEKGKVWKGSFKVDSDGNLSFAPHDSKTAFVFTRDGHTQRVPAEALAKHVAADTAGAKEQFNVAKAVEDMYKALEGVGTDEKTVLAILQGKSAAELKALAEAYKAKTGHSLDEALKSELSEGPYKAVQQMFKAMEDAAVPAKGAEKPKAGADAKTAEKPAAPTDGKAAEKPAGTTDAKAGAKGAEAPAKPGEVPTKPVDAAAMKKAAEDLYNATEGMIGTDEEAVYRILRGKSAEELKVIDAELKKKSQQGFGIEQMLNDEMSGLELQRALSFLKHTDTEAVKLPEGVDRAKIEAANEELYKATRRDEHVGETPEGWGTDEKAIFKVLEGKTPAELTAMDALFREKYGCSLEDLLKDELSGQELTRAQDLLKGVKLADHADGSQTKIYPDKARVEVDAQQRVSQTADAGGRMREFKYEGTQLTEVKSTFTGHTWKRTEVNGKEAWVNEKGKVWNGKFHVLSDGTLSFQPHDGKTSFVFSRDGKTLRVPSEGLEKVIAGDSGTTAKPVDQAAINKDVEALVKATTGVGTEEGAILKILQGKSAAAIKAIDEAYKKQTGQSLDQALKDKLSADDYKKAQQLMPKETPPADKPVARADAKPAEKPTAPTDGKVAAKVPPPADAKPSEKPAAPTDAKSVAKPVTPADAKPAEKPAPGADAKPAEKPKTGADAKPADKPTVGADSKPVTSGETKGAEKTAQPTDAKTAQPTDAKTAEKPQAPAEAKPEYKTTKNPDGSESRVYGDNSKIVVAGGKVMEATAADGHTRKFHYNDKGQLDQVDGRLGHWEKTTGKDGKEVWVNKDTGAKWKGEFTVDADGNLQFKRHDGGNLVFGRNGETVRIPLEGTGTTGGGFERTSATDVKSSTDAKPLTADQQKAVDVAAASPYFVTINTFVKGTPDAEKVIGALKGRSEAEIQIIKELYKKTNGTELEDDLKTKFPGNREIAQAFDKLGTPAEKRVDSQRVENLAKTLQGELDKSSFLMDEQLVVDVMKRMSEGEAQAVKAKYKELTGHELEADLRDELSGSDLKKAMTFLNRKDSEVAVIPEGTKKADIEKAVSEIHYATDFTAMSAFGSREDTGVNKALAGKTPEQLNAIKAMYLDKYGVNLDDKYKDSPLECTFDERVAKANEWKAEKEAEKVSAEARELKHGSWGSPDLKDVQPIIGGKTEAEKATLDAEFKKNYGKTIAEYLKDEMDEPDLSKALEIWNRKDAELVKIPDGVDRAQMREATEQIMNLPDMNKDKGSPKGYPDQIDPKDLHKILEGKSKEELQAMNVLFEERYGVTLEAHLQKHSFIKLGKLENYAKEAGDAKAAYDNFESNVKKVDGDKIAERAKKFHENTTTMAKAGIAESNQFAYNRPARGSHPAEEAIQDLSPAEIEAFKRYYKEHYEEDPIERVKGMDFYGKHLELVLEREPYSAIERIPEEKKGTCREAAVAMWRAMELADGTDEALIWKTLENKTAAERAAIMEYYRELSGGDSMERRMISELEEDAGELERGLNYLRIGSDVESANIHETLTDNNAAHAMERIATLPPDKVKEAEKDFEERYGMSLRHAIETDEGLPTKAKEALLKVLETTDKVQFDKDGKPILHENGSIRTDEEWVEVAELALHARELDKPVSTQYGDIVSVDGLGGATGDIEMFKNVMAAMPESARKKFAEKVPDTDPYFKDDGSEGDAEEYVKFGRLSTARKISKNDKANDDEAAIEKAADTMPKDERDQYNRGARLYKEKYLDTLNEGQLKFVNAMRYGEGHLQYVAGAEGMPKFSTDGWTDQEKKDFEVYRRQNAAIDGPADDTEARTWRDHSVLSGGANKFVEDFANIPYTNKEKPEGYKGPSWEELRDPAKKAAWLKENNIDLLSPHSQKIVKDALEKRLLAEKPGDLKYMDGKPLKDTLKLDSPAFEGMGGQAYFAGQMKPISNSEKEKMVESISNMTLADQKKYREDAEFRAKVDLQVSAALDGAQEDAAKHMLANLLKETQLPDGTKQYGYPIGDYIDQINIEAGKKETSEPQVIRILEAEIQKDHARVEQLKKEGKPVEPPELLERLKNPQTAEDRALKERVETALHRALETDEYEKWAKPLLENGRLTFEQKIKLDKEDGNKEDVFKDVKALATATDAASIEERKRLSSDSAYRQEVLGHLPADQREIAENIIKQSTMLPPELAKFGPPGSEQPAAPPKEGTRTLAEVPVPGQPGEAPPKPEGRAQVLERLKTDEAYRNTVLAGMTDAEQRTAIRVFEFGPVLPEDAVRGYRVGMQSNKEEMMATLREMNRNAGQEVAFKDSYANKYREEVGHDLAHKLGGKEEREMERLVRDNPKTGRELYFRTKEMADGENSGIGADITGGMWSAAGDLAVDSTTQMYAMLAKNAEKGKEVPPDDPELMALAKQSEEYTEMFITAKEECADMVSDVVLGIATIVVPGGWALRAAMIVAGGFAKTGMKRLLIGEKYQFTAADFVGGMVDTALSMVDPAKLGKAIGVGRKAATIAAREAGEQLVKIAAREGGEALLKKGGQEILEKEMRTLAANAIVDGSGKISKEALDKVVDKVAREGLEKAEREIIEKTVKESLEKQVESAVRSEVKNFIRGKVLEGGVGFLGGAGGGGTRALMEWDTSKSFSENMETVLKTGLMSGAFGAGGAVAFSTAFNVAGKGLGLAGKGYRVLAGKSDDVAGIIKAPHVVATEGEFAIVRPKDAPAPKVEDAINATPDAMKSGEFQHVGDHYVDADGNVYKDMGPGPDGTTKIAPDESAKIAASDDAIAKAEKEAAEARGKVGDGSDSPTVRDRGIESPAMTRDVPAWQNRIDQHPMGQAKSMDAFVDDVRKATKDWEDLTPTLKDLDAVEKDFGRKAYDYQEAVDGLHPPVSDVDFENPAVMRERLKGDPEKLKAMEDYFQVKQRKAELEAPIKQREKDLQGVVDRLAKEHGVPAPEVHLTKTSAKGEHTGTGDISLNRNNVMGADKMDVAGTVYHEFLHQEQTYTVLRKVADDAEVGKVATPDQIKEVQAAYKEATGQHISESQVQKAMAARDGRPLSTAETVRAQELADSFKNKQELGPDYREGIKNLGEIQKELRTLDNALEPKAPENLVKRMGDDPKLAEQLYGKPLPAEIKDLIDQHKAGRTIDWKKADGDLQKHMVTRGEQLQAETLATYDRYRSPLHEQEAHRVGDQVRDGGAGRGADSKPTESPAIRRDASIGGDDIDTTRLDLESGRARAERSALFGPDAVDGHVVRMEKIAQDFEDIRPLATKADQSRKELLELKRQFNKEVLGPLKGKVPDKDLIHLDDVRKHIANDPEKLAMLKKYEALRDVHAENQKAFRADLKERTGQIQKAMDELADSQGQAHVKVKLLDDASMPKDTRGMFNHADGTLYLRRSDFLGDGISSKGIDTLYHEFAHNEQNALIIRTLADDLKLGKDLSPADMKTLRDEFHKRTGSYVEPDRINDVLSREGKPLTTGDKARAYELADSLLKTPHGADFRQLQNDLNVAKSWRDKLGDDVYSDPQAAKELIKALKEDTSGRLKAHLAGGDAQKLDKLEQFARAYGDGKDLTPKSEKRLRDLIHGRVSDLENQNDTMFGKYRGSAHEEEAFAMGAAARMRARERGIGDPVDVPKSSPDVRERVGDRAVTQRGKESFRMDAPAGRADVAVDSPSKIHRKFKVGGEEFPLEAYPMQGRWFYGNIGAGTDAPIKVHVMVGNPKELGDIQRVLIPALAKDPELARMVANWKTFDPNIGVGKFSPGDGIPTGIGNDAKGFTIYLNDPADALRVQKKIDALLTEEGLALPKPLDTGNVDTISPGSNRVGIVRDAYPPAQTAAGKPAFGLDDRLAQKIHADAGVSGRPMTDAELRGVEQKVGLKEGTLAYSQDGKLVLQSVSSRVPETNSKRGFYAHESGLSTAHGQLTDRPALYALANHHGMDQAHLLATAAPAGDSVRVPRAAKVDEADMSPDAVRRRAEIEAEAAQYEHLYETQVLPDVIHVLDKAGIQGGERELILEWVRSNPMARPDVAKDFSQKMVDVTDVWRKTDISHLAGDPDALRRLVDQRKLELQNAMDQFTDANGMTRVKLEVFDDVQMGRSRAYNEGDRIVLRASDILYPVQPSQFNAIVYHEVGHSAQHSMMIRSVVQDMDVPVTAQQMERLQQLKRIEADGRDLSLSQFDEMQELDDLYQNVNQKYKDAVGGDVTLDHLSEVLKTPYNPRLEDSPFRAKVLQKAFKESGGFAEFENAGLQLMAMRDELANLVDDNGLIQTGALEDLMNRLNDDDGTLARQLFGPDGTPPNVQRHLNDSVIKQDWSREAALQGIVAGVKKNWIAVEEFQNAHLQRYLRGPHELEAYVVDKLVLNATEAIRPDASVSRVIDMPPVGVAPDTPVSMDAGPYKRAAVVTDDKVAMPKRVADAGDAAPRAGDVADARLKGATDVPTVRDPLDQPKTRMTSPEELDAHPTQKKALKDLQGDGRVAGKDVAEDFPIPTAREHKQWRADLEKDLREVPVDGAASVYDKIMDSPHLGDGQKERILDMLADVREHYRRLEPGLDGYQGVNWKHTRGEIDQVLEAAIKRNLSPREVEDAILASVFSDSVKFAPPPPPQGRANFIVHNVDGAKAAAEILPRYFDVSVPDNMARVEGIYRAILEHQVAPPDFMANMAANNMIGGKLRGMMGLKPGEAFPAKIPDDVLDKLGRSIHGDDAQKLAAFKDALKDANPKEVIASIQKKMQNPLDPQFRTVDPETGIAKTKFDPTEQALLDTIGVKDWYVPNPDSPWYGSTRAVIDGDGLINYATPDGWAKIAAIRGPGKEPWFADATVFDSLKSAKQSYDDAFKVMTTEGQGLAESGLARTEAAQGRMKQRMEDWFNSPEAKDLGLVRNADGTVPFWDAPLKYPKPLNADEAARVKVLQAKGDDLSVAEKAELKDLTNPHRGLTADEAKQFDFAKQIRERTVEDLRKEQNVFMKAGDGGGTGGGAGGPDLVDPIVGTARPRAGAPEVEPLREPIVRSNEGPAGRGTGDARADAVSAVVAPQRPDGLLQGDRIAIESRRYEVAGFDPETGNAVLRRPGHTDSNLANMVEAKDFPAEMANYRQMEFDGKTYYVRDGNMFIVQDVLGGRMKLFTPTEFSIRPRQELESANFLGGGEFRRGKLRDMAEHDLFDARLNDAIVIRNPENADIMVGNHRVAMQDGQLAVTRELTMTGSASVGDLRVSRNHGSLRWDAEQSGFVYSDHSTHGTYIKRGGSGEFERVHQGQTRIGPNDEIRLGSPDGPQLRLAGTPDAHVQSATQRVDQQVYFGSRPLHLSTGESMKIGRPDMGHSGHDLMSALVSREHGTLGLDDSGRLVYQDHSSNGTYIKRAGSDRFEVIREGQRTFINSGDEVRLGSQYGPELKHSAVHGQTHTDGSVTFQRAGEDVWHRPDGLFQVSDRAGSLRLEDQTGRITWVRDASGMDRSYQYGPNGELTSIQFQNGRTLEYRQGEGWMISQPGQPQSRWAGDIEVGPDGSLVYGDGVNPPVRERLDGSRETLHANGRVEYSNARYEVERLKLDRLADYHFHDPAQRARFRDITQWFENRAVQSGLSREEVAMTLHHVNRLVQGGDGAPIGMTERVRLAEQILQQSGFPPTIDQGINGTCNVATVEKRMFSREPSQAARMITDVATTGRYVTADGRVVDLGRVPGGLKPDAEARMGLSRPFDGQMHTDIKMDGRRTYASQIYENTAVNVKYAKPIDPNSPQTEFVMYEKHPSTRPGDSGERLVKYRANADGSITATDLADNPHVADSELTDIYNKITGGNERDFVIRGPGYAPAPDGMAVAVTSARDLERTLQRMADQRKFPVIIMVDCAHPPFNRFINVPEAGGTGGMHVVNIEGFHRDPSGRMMIEFSNQWGSQANHMGRDALPVDVIFNATRPLPQRRGGGGVREFPTSSAGDGGSTGGGASRGGDAVQSDVDVRPRALDARPQSADARAGTTSGAKKSDAYFDEIGRARDAQVEALETEALDMGRELAERSKLADPKVLDAYAGSAKRVIGEMEDLRPLLNGNDQDALSGAVRLRESQFQGLADQLSDSTGMSRVKVELAPDSQFPPDGLAHFDGNGTMYLRQSHFMDNSDPNLLMKALYQEFTHHEQLDLVIRRMAITKRVGNNPTPDKIADLEMEIMLNLKGTVDVSYIDNVLGFSRRRDVRNLADELGMTIRKEPTPQQMKQLRDQYKERTGLDLSETQAKEGLGLTPIRKLSRAEKERADELLESMGTRLDETELSGVQERRQLVRQELTNLLDNPDGAQNLLERLNNREHRELWDTLHLYDDRMLPTEMRNTVNFLRYDLTEGTLPANAAEQLAEVLKLVEGKLFDKELKLYKVYRTAPHELEGYAIELEVERRLRRAGDRSE